MVEVYTPLSFWMQSASFAFILAGTHGDLLVIRACLFCGYLLMLINTILGSPLWPNFQNTGGIGIDGLFWNLLGVYVHGSSLFSLIRDERPVQLQECEAALWRMLYRTGGLSARLYKTIVSPHMQVMEFSEGEEIPTDDYFYIVYQGLVHLRVLNAQGQVRVEKRVLQSGEMFDLKHVGMFREDSIFDDHHIECTSLTKDTILFRFSRSCMLKIAQHNFSKGVWQALLINNLTYVVENYVNERYGSHGSRRGGPGDGGIDRIFSPLEDWEIPTHTDPGSGAALTVPLQHLLASVRRSFGPPWPLGEHPCGIRQTLLKPPQPPSSDDSTVSLKSGEVENMKDKDRALQRERVSFCTILHGPEHSSVEDDKEESTPDEALDTETLDNRLQQVLEA